MRLDQMDIFQDDSQTQVIIRFLSEVGLHFDWQEQNYWYPQQLDQQLNPGQSYPYFIQFTIPNETIGMHNFRFDVNMSKLERRNWNGYASTNNYYWTTPELTSTVEDNQIRIQPFPRLSAFVSRSAHSNDAPVIDPIVNKITDWGFDPVTVGINVFTEFNNVPLEVRQQIIYSDCLIAIATKRDISAVTGLWKTLEWLHNEVGIAFGLEKPILVLRDYEVQVGGLPSIMPAWQIPFDVYNLQAIERDLARHMPTFRQEILNTKSRAFWKNIGKVSLPLLAGFAAGAVVGPGIARALRPV